MNTKLLMIASAFFMGLIGCYLAKMGWINKDNTEIFVLVAVSNDDLKKELF